jgi:hypothetical protein
MNEWKKGRNNHNKKEEEDGNKERRRIIRQNEQVKITCQAGVV